MRTVMLLVVTMLCLAARGQSRPAGTMADSVQLGGVTVTGKSRVQRLRESAFTVNAIDVSQVAGALSSLSGVVDRTAGVKLREEGGVGSDFDLSINGLSGNSVRYFVDGMPIDVRGQGVTLANLPISLIDRVEIYKGVVPTYLGSDALGGAVNIVTLRQRRNFLDASYSVGSYHTHRADLNAQYVLRCGLELRPTVGLCYSKNDYMMHGVEVWDEAQRKYVEADRRRFHDDYRSLTAQMEVGVSGRRWADDLAAAIYYNKVDKELQTNQLQSKVVGMAERQMDAWGLTARYRKRGLLTPRLNASLQVSHTWDNSLTVDTAYRKYDWNGDYIYSARNELNGRGRSMRHYRRPLTVGRADLAYDLSASHLSPPTSHLSSSASHLLNLSYSVSRTGNDRWDDADATFDPADDALTKHVAGLSYSQTLFGGRLMSTLFAKEYVSHVSIEQTDLQTITGSASVRGTATKGYTGYGAGSRLTIAEPLQLKVSFEHSVRLPLARELLGNGATIYANVAIEPEKSNNLNVGLFGTWRPTAAHTLYYEVNGLLRYVDNYIQPQVSEKEGMLQYVNVPAVRIKGVEGEVRYGWQRLSLTANLSWQDARDRMKFKADGKPSVTYNNHVPNRPWLFSAVEARYSVDGLFGDGDRLTVGADYQWVHWFFLSWEGYGALDTKARIPEKNVVGALLTYSWHGGRYSVSADCQNLLDATVYDNYKLQKPGRMLTAKFRLQLR